MPCDTFFPIGNVSFLSRHICVSQSCTRKRGRFGKPESGENTMLPCFNSCLFERFHFLYDETDSSKKGKMVF